MSSCEDNHYLMIVISFVPNVPSQNGCYINCTFSIFCATENGQKRNWGGGRGSGGDNQRERDCQSQQKETDLLGDLEKTMHRFFLNQKNHSIHTVNVNRDSVQLTWQSTPHSFKFTFFSPAMHIAAALAVVIHDCQPFSRRGAAPADMQSAWEVFSHLPVSGAEVNPKDLLFSGIKISSLTCVKVSITLLVMT